MSDLRDAEANDDGFLAEMLAVAADWRPGEEPRPLEEIMRIPELAHYIAGWPRAGDCGVVAQSAGQPIGAAWFRFPPSSDGGYGYVSDDVPEITIAVRRDHRRKGTGRALLLRLLQRAREAHLRALSLSVEEDNPAMRLYEELGFTVVERAEGAATMLLRLE